MKLRLTWRSKLILFMEGVLVLLLLVLLWYINTYLFQMLLRNNEESQMKNLQYVESQLDETYGRMENLGSAVFINSDVSRFCSGNYMMDKEGVLLRLDVMDYLDRQLQLYPDVHSIFVRTAAGTEIGTEENYTYNTYGSTQLLTGTRGEWRLEQIPSHSLQTARQGWLLSLSNTYRSQDGDAEIILKLEEQSIRQFYEGFIEKGDADILICDQSGTILSSSVQAQIGTVFEPFGQQIQGERQGSFVFDTQQVIFLTAPSLGWVVIEKMPLEHFNRDINSVRKTLIWLVAVTMLLVNLFIYVMMRRMLQPLKTLTTAMHQMQQGEIGYQIRAVYHNEFDDIIGTFNAMSKSTADLIEQNQIREEQKQRYALSALRAQINPHFLFNTINTIKWMAISRKADNIKSALDMLMVLLRPLFKENTDETTLQEELDYVSNYIALVNLRFGGNVELIADVSDKLLARKVPCFMLQPIIENCIEHGFEKNFSQAKIIVDAEEQQDGLLLTIEDNGVGMPDEKLAEIRARLASTDSMLVNGDKLGLTNVHLRIRLKYGDAYGLSIDRSRNGGTVVMVKLPSGL